MSLRRSPSSRGSRPPTLLVAQRSAVARAATTIAKRRPFCERIVDGDRAANALIELINLKDTAQYGLIPITKGELTTTLRRAKTLLEFAREVIRR